MSDFELRVTPYPGCVRARFAGVPVAETSRAIVLHETRQPPRLYVPRDDVRAEFLVPSDRRTHCPFKGDASYWTLRVGERRADSAVWAYETPLEEVAALEGYMSFYPDKVTLEDDAGLPITLAATQPEAPHGNPIAAWLVRQAWKAADGERLVSGFCDCLLADGVSIARMTVIIPTLHPQIFASVFVWRSDTREVRTIFEPHDILHQPKFAHSPFAPIIKGSTGVRRRLEGERPTLDFPVLRELHAEGATDYVAMPFRFSDGQINVMSMTSFAPGGFTTAHLGNVFEALPALGRIFEVHALRRISVSLLETYLGRNTGKRVLDGEIRQGDGQLIHAVIWFCDLRNSTALASSLDHASYLANLNRFFTAMAGAILDHGGEILSYIGDAVLAIFPITGAAGAADTGHAEEACRHAIEAARAAGQRIAAANVARPDLPALGYGIGLHVGDVTYGNIGVPQRLQFTVIGSAANEASRIEGMTKELRVPVLVSARFASHYPHELVSQGAHALKGVAGLQELFALA
jgi:class 3 adenylate cyclase/uncharacterized protein (DUF427 family)